MRGVKHNLLGTDMILALIVPPDNATDYIKRRISAVTPDMGAAPIHESERIATVLAL